MRRHLVALAALFVAAPALAQSGPPTDWRILDVSPLNVSAYSPSTVRRGAALAVVVVLWRFRDPVSDSVPADSLMARRGDMRIIHLDCAKGQFRNGGIRYFGADLKLMTVKSGADPWTPMDRSYPLYAAICDGKPLPGEPVSTRPVEDQLAYMTTRMTAAAKAAPPVTFTPQERAAILCSERAALLQEALVAELAGATRAKEAAINADYAALAKLSDAFDGMHPTYPNTPEGKRKLDAQSQLLANDVVANAAFDRWDQGDRAALIGLMRRCEVMSGAKVLGPTFGTW